MRTRFLIPVFAPLLALFAHGQQIPSGLPSDGGGDAYQLSTTPNCADPAQASSPQCGGGQGVSMPSGQNAAAGAAGAETMASQPGRVVTYSDTTPQPNHNAQRGRETYRTPLPLTEFQKFVAVTTAEVLPIYGESLFQNTPSTFAPLENTPIPSSYVLGPGDEIRMRVWGQVNFNANLTVDRSGDVFVPQIGVVHVAGLRVSEIQDHLHDAIARVYRHFQLLVDIGQIRSMQVYVIGEARAPGVYTVSALSTLIDTLFASGGPALQGSMRSIELRRGGKTITTLDLYKFLVDGDKSQDAPLMSGDVIYIPPVHRQVAVLGSVRHPAIYELLDGETVGQVLRDAGGTTAMAADARASLERNQDHSGRQAVEIGLDTAGLATPLRNGDILRILPLVSQFHDTVTLRGNTANPGRFAWHQGMRLSDLIPDRDALLTRNYWWKRVEMGLPAPEFEPLPLLSTLRQPAAPVDLRDVRMPAARSGNATNASAQTSGAPSSEDAYQGYGPAAAAMGASGNTPQSAAALQNQEQNTEQKAESSASNSSIAEASEEAQNQQPRTQVRLTVPEIDWSYAVIERLDPITLKTSLIPFDLGRLVIDHDPSQDLELQPEDIVTIFSQSDIHVPIAEQTAFIHLEGEVAHAGAYSVLPGETLRDVVRRAGGLTANAYLYGSVFTRESTRVQQQRRIDESIHEMTLQMQRGNLALAAAPATTPQDLAGMSAAQASERAIIAELKQVRATGRIVLQFKPGSQGIDSIPNLKLENGDRFLIPSVPYTVNVVGAVFNQNSFVYAPGAEVRSFLDLAGGPNGNADRKQMFVVRANGAVVSRKMVKGAWGDEFMRLRLYPGDSIIVPEKSIKPSIMRGIIDWSQVFSQFAFGAAAIDVLR